MFALEPNEAAQPDVSLDTAVGDLCEAQHGVISRAQFLDLGSKKQLEYRCRKKVLDRVLPCVYRVHGAPPTWRQSMLASCWASGKLSAASVRSACALWHLPAGDELLEITSLRHRRVRIDGVIPHESYYLTERDVTYIDNIPVTRVARTLNDLGLLVVRHELSRTDLEFNIHEAVRRNLTDLSQLWRAWLHLGGVLRPGGELMEDVFNHFVPPSRATDTTAEMKLLLLLRAAGLAEPVPQHRVWISPTRWYDLDLAWPELKAFVEFNPEKWHGFWSKHVKDNERLHELQRLGWEGVSVLGNELDDGAVGAIVALRTILNRRAALLPHASLRPPI